MAKKKISHRLRNFNPVSAAAANREDWIHRLMRRLPIELKIVDAKVQMWPPSIRIPTDLVYEAAGGSKRIN